MPSAEIGKMLEAEADDLDAVLVLASWRIRVNPRREKRHLHAPLDQRRGELAALLLRPAEGFRQVGRQNEHDMERPCFCVWRSGGTVQGINHLAFTDLAQSACECGGSGIAWRHRTMPDFALRLFEFC